MTRITINRNYLRIIIGFSILIVFAILVQLRRDINRRNDNIDNLPLFIIKDNYKRTIDSHNYLGKCTYIQFIYSKDPNDIRLLESVYSNWKDEEINIILISNEKIENILRINMSLRNRVIMIPNNDLLHKLFKVKEEIGVYFIFDKAGKLIYMGNSNDNYECKAKIYLKRLIRNERFDIEGFINPKQNIYSSEILSNIAWIIRKENREICILSFFNKICDTCSGGRLIERMNELYSQKGNKILILSIISDKYNKEDVEKLRQQMDIKYQILNADGLLSQTWNRLIEEYCDNELTDLIFIIDKEGEILRYADRNCNCYKELFEYIENIGR